MVVLHDRPFGFPRSSDQQYLGCDLVVAFLETAFSMGNISDLEHLNVELLVVLRLISLAVHPLEAERSSFEYLLVVPEHTTEVMV